MSLSTWNSYSSCRRCFVNLSQGVCGIQMQFPNYPSQHGCWQKTTSQMSTTFSFFFCFWNSNFHCHIWNQYKKYIQTGTNKLTIASVGFEIAPCLLRKYFQISSFPTLPKTLWNALKALCIPGIRCTTPKEDMGIPKISATFFSLGIL